MASRRTTPGTVSPAVRALALESLRTCWSNAGLPAQGLGQLLDRVWATRSWSAATESARLDLAGIGMSRSDYAAARNRKFDSFGQILKPLVNGVVLDVGAGGPDLLERLPAQTRVATDILPATRNAPGIPHVVQLTPDALPFEDESFDTVIMTGMAHHLDADVRTRLLRDVHRCLRPGGRVLLIEETFSDHSGGGPVSEPSMAELSIDFDALTRADRFEFLAFTDWWGNRVMKGSDDIPLPLTFLDLEDWQAVLRDAGLPVVRVEQFGVMSGGGHLATPRALIVGSRA